MHPNRLQTLFLNFGHFFDHMLILIYATAVISIGIEFNKSYGEILAIATPGFLLYGCMSMPFGWIGDRKGRHSLMVFFFIGIGLATFFTAFSTSIWQIGIGLTFIGFFAAIYHPVGIPMLIQGVKRPGRVLGANGVFGNMGVAAAPLIVGALVTTYGWRGAFIAPGISCMIIGILFWKLVPVDAPTKPSVNKSGKVFNDFMLGWRRVFIIIGTITLVAGFIFNSTTVSLPKLFQERFTDAIPSTIGFTALASLVYACASFAQIAAGHAVDRFSARTLLIGLLCGQIVSLPLMAFSHGPMLFITSLFAMSCVFGQIPIIDTIITRYVPDSHRGRVLSIKYLLNLSVGAMAIPAIASLHTWGDGFSTLFKFLGVIAIIMTVAAFSLQKRLTAAE